MLKETRREIQEELLKRTPPRDTRRKATKVVIIVALVGFAVGLTLLIIGGMQLRPPKPQLPSSSLVPLEEPVRLPSSQEPDDQYLTGKLYTTPERTDYESGQMLLKIPAMGVDKAVEAGTSHEAMAMGPSLYDYAQLPGEGNRNVSLVAHRDIKGAEFYFAHKLGEGDLFYLVYKNNIYVYSYERTYIIQPDDWSPIFAAGYSCITLTTCHPIGTTLQRMVVRGKLVEIKPYSADYNFRPWAEGVTKPFAWEPEAVAWDKGGAVASSTATPTGTTATPTGTTGDTPTGTTDTPTGTTDTPTGTTGDTPTGTTGDTPTGELPYPPEPVA